MLTFDQALLKAGPPDEPRDPKTGKWTTGGLAAERENFSRMSRRQFLRATAESAAVLALVAGPPIRIAARLYNSSKMRSAWEGLGEASRESLARNLEAKGFRVDRNEDGSIDVWTQKGEPVWRSPKGKATHKAGEVNPLRPGHEARDLLQRTLDARPTPTRTAFEAKLPLKHQSFLIQSRERLRNETPTDRLFRHSGAWDPEREALHERLIQQRLNDARERAKPAPGEKPKLVVIGGRPGSGKTTALMESGLVPDREKYLYINADDLRGDNDKFREGNDRYGLPGYEGWNSALYHTEASGLMDELEKRARALHLNIIHDATMRSVSASEKLIHDFENEGYDISGLFVHASPENAATRAIDRGMKPDGRFVPTYILGQHVNEAAFDAVKHRMTNWQLYDANGKKAKLVASGNKDQVVLSKVDSPAKDHASPQILRELVKESLAGLKGNMKDHIDEICNLVYEMDYAPDIPKGAGDWHQALINMGDSLNHMVYGKNGTGGYGKANPYHDARGRFTTGPGGGSGPNVKPKAPRGGKGGKNTKGGKKALAAVAAAATSIEGGSKPAEVAHKVAQATGGFKEWVTRAWDSLEDDAKEEVLTLAVAVTVTTAVGLYLYFGALPSPLGAARDMFGWLWRQLR